jgi:hypothetical protein
MLEEQEKRVGMPMVVCCCDQQLATMRFEVRSVKKA